MKKLLLLIPVLFLNCASPSGPNMAGTGSRVGNAFKGSGQIIYPGGNPAVGANVYLYSKSFTALFADSATLHKPPVCKTDSAGEFYLTVEDTGEYVLVIEDTLGTGVRRDFRMSVRNTLLLFKQDTMRTFSSIEGRLSQRGIVQDKYGLRPPVYTDSAGMFVLGKLPAGEYPLMCVPGAIAQYSAKDTLIQVKASDTIRNLSVTLTSISVVEQDPIYQSDMEALQAMCDSNGLSQYPGDAYFVSLSENRIQCVFLRAPFKKITRDIVQLSELVVIRNYASFYPDTISLRISPEISTLKHLMQLWLPGCNVRTLPLELMNLDNRVTVQFQDNHLCGLSDTMALWLDRHAQNKAIDWRISQGCGNRLQ